MWIALRGTGNLLSGGIASASTKTNLDYYRFFGSNVPGTAVPTIFALMLIVVLIAAFILAKTRFGSDAYATGGNVESARNNGIRTRRVKWTCFIVTGGLVGLASSLQFGRLANSPFNGGNGFELQVIAGVIIGGVGLFGGRGTVFGSLIGVDITRALLVEVEPDGIRPSFSGQESVIDGSAQARRPILLFSAWDEQPKPSNVASKNVLRTTRISLTIPSSAMAPEGASDSRLNHTS